MPIAHRFAILLTTLHLAGCPAVEETSPSAAIDTERGHEASEEASPDSVEWPRHGLDHDEQRFSPLDRIHRGNVDELGLVWSFDLEERRGVEATPLMLDGVLYVTAGWSVVYALDAASGELLWRHDPQVPRSFLAKGCCDAVNRGVAHRNGRIFVGTYDGRLVALDAKTGDVIWDVQTTDRSQPYTITGAPRVAGDKVVIGNGGAELGVRGYVSAYDADTGELAWRFHTVPGDPAHPFENAEMERAAATWSGKWWKWGGGGTVWDAITVDPELDLLYIGVGNGSPWNQELRSPDGGDNLFLASIVALRPDTGEYVWHYQTTPGETWDFTATQHIMLADLEIEGRMRKVLMQAPKNGFFYVLDRETGELLSAEPYTTVNWATGIDPETGRPIETTDARTFDGEHVVVPSNGGGHNWPAMSFNPKTGLVYIPTMVFPATFKSPTEKVDREPGGGRWNVGFDRMGAAPPELPEEEVNRILDEAFSGQLVAWDPVAQKARWKGKIGRPTGGGTLSTAGGLVFQGGQDGHIHAYDAATGEDLWSHDTQTGAMAPPITFALGGKQFITAAVGFGGGFAAEGGVVAHGWKIPNVPRVLVFALGGNKQLPPSEVTERPLPKPAPVTATAEVVARGKVVYQRQCAYCHGDGLRTGGLNPDLRYSPPGIHQIWEKIVIDGILEANGMVNFAEFATPEDAEAIRQYVLSEAQRLHESRQ
jgi:PQQ-dependent dehydrogenase (methanol/ethanol family)